MFHLFAIINAKIAVGFIEYNVLSVVVNLSRNGAWKNHFAHLFKCLGLVEAKLRFNIGKAEWTVHVLALNEVDLERNFFESGLEWQLQVSWLEFRHLV